MKARDFRFHFDCLFEVRMGKCKVFFGGVVEISIGASKAEVRCARAGIKRYRALELLDRPGMPRHSVEDHTQLMVRTKMIRGKFNLPAVRSLSLFELLSVEQEPRQALLSREQYRV